jgi:hypothetical protein
VPVFQIPAPPKETHESIFGENHSDDLFEGASRTPRPIMPDAPAPRLESSRRRVTRNRRRVPSRRAGLAVRLRPARAAAASR